jgi:murein DD-endopeptidase MepM/ murein hydrolase activator NlpD
VPTDQVAQAQDRLQQAQLQLQSLTAQPDQTTVDAAQRDFDSAKQELAALYAAADAAVKSNVDADPQTALTRLVQIGGNAPDAVPFTWPARGPITSFFGPSHPLGVDIGQGLGLPVRAAASGVVAFSGGDPCCSYGYYVDIVHPGGYMTRYGHLMTPSFLKAGDRVTQGQIIGVSGATGFATGPHLHFEIRFNGVPLDPLRLLAGVLPAPTAR